MKRRIELLAPGGDMDSIKAAIAAGADAVYCGIHKFNARNRAANITFDDLNGLLRLAHSKGCKIFLTLNILIVENEIPDLIRLLNRLVNTSIDGVIIQDLGLFYLLSRYFKELNIHASTQLTTHNEGQIRFLKKLNASRVNLSRELNLEEIQSLSSVAHQNAMLSEVFIHGSYCISFSGLCYMSSLHGGNSGNRGRCSQPCRDSYTPGTQGKHFPLNLKDNSALPLIGALAGAGADSLKIEGRIKKYHYVYTVVENYKTQLQRYHEGNMMNPDNSSLYKVFNRDFSSGYLMDEIGREMFIDNPRDHSATHLAEQNGPVSLEAIENAEKALYKEKGDMRDSVKRLIDRMRSGKAPLRLTASGKEGEALKLDIVTPEGSFSVSSAAKLEERVGLTLNENEVLKRFKALNETEFFLEKVDLKGLQPGLYIPFSELTSLKKKILVYLRNGKQHHSPLKIKSLTRAAPSPSSPALSALISCEKDLQIIKGSAVEIFFQIPDTPSEKLDGLIRLFRENRRLTPWFPSILIGKDYQAAVEFLHRVRPEKMVTDNSGIAYEAFGKGLKWIAGPRLNIVNSYALQCLKEDFSCSGAYLSNELKRQQIQGIKKPEDFQLFYSIYHPIDLMTSRQCLFQQVTGCHKQTMDKECIPGCRKSASLSNQSKGTLFIEKTEHHYPRIYNEFSYLNTEIVSDMPDFFDGFLLDLREIKTKTSVEKDQPGIIKLFDDLLKGKPGAAQRLKRVIHPTSLSQYRIGI